MNVVMLAALVPALREAFAALPPFDDFVAVNLIKEPFVATPTTDYGALAEADFPGYASANSSAAAELIYDPVEGKWFLELPDPTGGWSWTRAAGAGDPQTIYGVSVVDVGGANIPPVPITNEGDNVSVGTIRIPMPLLG